MFYWYHAVLFSQFMYDVFSRFRLVVLVVFVHCWITRSKFINQDICCLIKISKYISKQDHHHQHDTEDGREHNPSKDKTKYLYCHNCRQKGTRFHCFKMDIKYIRDKATIQGIPFIFWFVFKGTPLVCNQNLFV